MAVHKLFKFSSQCSGNLFFCALLICLLPAGGYSAISSVYSIEVAAGWTNNVDHQPLAQSSGLVITTFNGLWSLAPEKMIPVELNARFSNTRYTKDDSSQHLELDSGFWLWKTDAAELILHGRWQYYHNGRLPADNFHSPSATLMMLARRPPFLIHLAQDLHWNYFKKSVEIGETETRQQQGQQLASESRHEYNRRSRFGVDVRVTPNFNLSSAISYIDNRASIASERWYAYGVSLGMQWWPQQFWQGQLWWQQQRTYYRETVNQRHDRIDNLTLRIDYHPGAWQYYTQWQWQRNKSPLAAEDYRGQEIICGLIYHF